MRERIWQKADRAAQVLLFVGSVAFLLMILNGITGFYPAVLHRNDMLDCGPAFFDVMAWEDVNGNGQREAAESYLSSVLVSIPAEGNYDFSRVTTSSGHSVYQKEQETFFPCNGDWGPVTAQVPAGYRATTPVRITKYRSEYAFGFQPLSTTAP